MHSGTTWPWRWCWTLNWRCQIQRPNCHFQSSEIIYFCLIIENLLGFFFVYVYVFVLLFNFMYFFCLSLFSVSSPGCITNIPTPLFENKIMIHLYIEAMYIIALGKFLSLYSLSWLSNKENTINLDFKMFLSEGSV